MLRWFLGSREPQSGAEKSSVLNIGEEQTQNPYTELSPLQEHQGTVRFLVQIDDFRFASAGDDGFVFVWDVKTGEILFPLHGHLQEISAMVVFKAPKFPEGMSNIIITSSSERTIIAWDCESGLQLYKISDFQSTVKSLVVIHSLDVWLSGGSDVRVWNRDCQLLCKTGYYVDGGISALIELPKTCVAAAVGKDLIIFKLSVSENFDQWNISEIKCISVHQHSIQALININDLMFASCSDAGELVIWDAVDWRFHSFESNISDISSPHDSPQEATLAPMHISTDGENVFAAVGRGLFVYSVQARRVIALQKKAHDSNVLYIGNLPNRQLVSCLDDGSVRIWELRSKVHPHAEPVPTGFFSMLGFGKANKQASQSLNKVPENGIVASLDLIGDLIGHSSSVQMFIYFEEDHSLVTCSADQLIIIWKEGKIESRLRSQLLFKILDESSNR
uniref:WD repeat domain 41 n=1 Tax=Leptobrachium leishanense TaxID=445787 RepID=A0A8C5PV31_9ANUR